MTDSSDQRLLAQSYSEDRKLYTEIGREAARNFNQAVMKLAGGAVGLSLASTKLFNSMPEFIWMLWLAWISLALSLSIIIHADLLSQQVADSMLKVLDQTYRMCSAPHFERLSLEKKCSSLSEEANAISSRIRHLNMACLVAFSTGLAAQLAFFTLNSDLLIG